VNARAATGTDTSAPTVAAGTTLPTQQRPRQEVPDEHRDQTHQSDVRTQRRQPAVREQQPLHQQHRRHHQYGGPRPDQRGGQRTSEQVTAGARADREVHHLHREHECRRQPGQRRTRLAELTIRPLQAEADRPGRDQAGGDGRGRVEEAVRNMHAHIVDLFATRSQQESQSGLRASLIARWKVGYA
jgi:hypothetical protein